MTRSQIFHAAHASARGLVGCISLDGTTLTYRQAFGRGLAAAYRAARKAAAVAVAATRPPVALAVGTGRLFGKGVQNARRLGARFDAARKVWMLDAARWAATTPTDREGLSVAA